MGDSFRSRQIVSESEPLVRGGVPWVWKLSMVFRPQAWPFLRSVSVQRDRFPVGRQHQPGAGIRHFHAVAAGFVDVQEEGLLHRVLVRPGFDEHAVLEEDVGRAAGSPRGCRVQRSRGGNAPSPRAPRAYRRSRSSCSWRGQPHAGLGAVIEHDLLGQAKAQGAARRIRGWP